MRSARIASACAIAVLAAIAACADDLLVNPVPVTDAGAPDATPADGASDAGRDAPPSHSEFGLDVRPTNPTCRAPARPPPPGAITTKQVFENLKLDVPSMMAQPPGDRTRWFASTLIAGQLVSFPTVNPGFTPTVVADLSVLSGIPISSVGESGFLGFAFHPKFAQNGRVYVTWNSEGGPANQRSRVGYITSTDGGATFTSYTNLIVFEQSAVYHHGGGIAFGPDGDLYVSFGNGLVNDAQDTSGFFGKILRIDVDNVPAGQDYGIPSDNPFASGGGEPATYAYGLRNPFRFAFDRATGDLYAADVGDGEWEEIDLVKRGGNYGYPCREGAHDVPGVPPSCAVVQASSTDPIFEVAHAGTPRAIIGGTIYRGSAIPDLVGAYVFGDFETQEVDTLRFDPSTGAPSMTVITNGPLAPMNSFAEDVDGELYVVGTYGAIYELVPAPADAGVGSPFPDRLSKTGCDPRSAPGLVPYTVNAPLWSDGADKTRWLALPDGKTIDVGADGDFDLPIGSVLVKTFALGGTSVETRLLVRHDDGGWAGYTYEWLDDASDAVLLASSNRKSVGGTSWYFPSRSDCAECHTGAAGHTLGLELGQLDGDLVYASTNRVANQLRTLEHIGMFTAPLPALGSITPYPTPTGAGAVDARARAFLHANCSMCHRPNGGGRGDMDLRFAGSLADTKTCNVAAATGAKLLVPGDPSRSEISLRPHAQGEKRMPPLATGVVDTAELAVLDAWISSLSACP